MNQYASLSIMLWIWQCDSIFHCSTRLWCRLESKMSIWVIIAAMVTDHLSFELWLYVIIAYVTALNIRNFVKFILDRISRCSSKTPLWIKGKPWWQLLHMHLQCLDITAVNLNVAKSTLDLISLCCSKPICQKCSLH